MLGNYQQYYSVEYILKTISSCYSSDIIKDCNMTRVEIAIDIVPAHKPSTFCVVVACLGTLINSIYWFTFVWISTQSGSEFKAFLTF